MSPFIPMFLAIVGLLIGPGLYAVPHWRTWDRVLDSFTLVAVGGLAVFHLLPEAVEQGGPLALLLAGMGVLLPRALRTLEGVGPWVLLIGLAGHAALEAAALGAPGHHAPALGMAVVLHRVPVGLAVFAMYHEHPRTSGMGWVAIGGLIVSTGVGFFVGPTLHAAISSTVEAGLSALVAGMLLHVVWEHGEPHAHEEEDPHGREGSHAHAHVEDGSLSTGGAAVTLAALAGAAVVAGMLTWGHAHHGPHTLETSWEVTRTGAPGMLLGLVGMGLLTWMVPAHHRARAVLQPDGRGSGAPGLVAIGASLLLLGPVPTLLWAGAAWAIRWPLDATHDRAIPAMERSLGALAAGLLGCAFVPVLVPIPQVQWLGLLALPVVLWLDVSAIVLVPMVAVGWASGLPIPIGLGMLVVSGGRPRDAGGWGRLVGATVAVMLGGSVLNARLPVLSVGEHLGSPGPVQTVALLSLMVVAVAALVRRGPRGLLEGVRGG